MGAVVLVPEKPFRISEVISLIAARRKRKLTFSIIVVTGTKRPDPSEDFLSEETKAMLYNERNINYGASPFIGFIARRVLARMGTPAEKEILEIIGSQRPTEAELKADPNLNSYHFDPSKVEGFADVLTQIEGKQNALLKLQDGQTKAKNPTIKAQFQAVIDVVKKARHEQSNTKPTQIVRARCVRC